MRLFILAAMSLTVPARGQTTWKRSWLPSTSTTLGLEEFSTVTPIFFYNDCLVAFSEATKLVHERWWYRAKLMHKKIFEIQPTLLTYYQDSRKKSLHVIDRFSFDDHRLFHCLHCNDFLLSCAVECLSNQTFKEDPLFYAFFQGILNINCLWSDLSIHTVVQKRLIFCQGV